MVLVIGLVVDDVIIVVENVYCYIEEGEICFNVVIKGVWEMVVFIIVMIIILVVVYVFIGFMGGLVGFLFIEFVFILVGVVVIFGIVVLILLLMLLGKVFKFYGNLGKFENLVECSFNGLFNGYKCVLSLLMEIKFVVVFFVVVVFGFIYFMVMMS